MQPTKSDWIAFGEQTKTIEHTLQDFAVKQAQKFVTKAELKHLDKALKNIRQFKSGAEARMSRQPVWHEFKYHGGVTCADDALSVFYGGIHEATAVRE